jgi:hypothetical protein
MFVVTVRRRLRDHLRLHVDISVVFLAGEQFLM